MIYRYEILTQLLKYRGKDGNRLHMPGHKNVSFFRSAFPVAPIDVTELSFSDDLQCPDGAIAAAQRDIAEIDGAKRAYITTDGSSSGVMAMVFVASRYGSKLIVPRASHKSVFNACRLMGVEPVIVQGEEKDGVLGYPSAQLIEKLIAGDRNIAGVIITSPDYYGNIAPLGEYSKVLKRHNRLLFADGAHGAHLALEGDRAGYAGVYADMWVDGAHKTLPTLTQGAVVLVGNEYIIPAAEEALSLFRTTSPSYPIMASVEYGIKYFVNNPAKLARAKAAVAKFREETELPLYPSADWTKLAVDFKPLNADPSAVQRALEKKGIYAEMNDGRYLLFYLSPAVEPWQLTELKGALGAILSKKKLKGTYRERPVIPVAERTYSFLYAHRQQCEYVPLDRAVGRMCAENAGITPPCLPIVIAGEIVTPQAAELLGSAKNTFGLTDGKIKVVRR